ncbi:MAG: D-alanine--poly(phosphoribitol) ligase subunit DltA [Massilibacteroides sp.]|nr:D-alanine--poly(phosphoribitol) ligase subunit DltA [Massilibacteroides sp.]
MDILKQIRKHARECGDRIAVRAGDSAVTYQQLDDYSDRLAAWILKNYQDEEKTPIVVYGHKSALMIISFLACVKAGRAYCPVDISVPLSRVQGILEVVNPPVVLAAEELEIPYSHVLGAAELQRIMEEDCERIPEVCGVNGQDLFYIIFTSGSTGTPKGVEITTDCLNNFLDWSVNLGTEMKKKEGRAFLNQAPFSFDLSVMDLYTCLACGGTLCTMDKSVQMDFAKLMGFFETSGINIWVSTPSFADLCLTDLHFSSKLLPDLEVFLFCGETLTNNTARKLQQRFPDAVIINTYGPTESTVAMTEVLVTPELAEQQNPLPVGSVKPDSLVEIRREDGSEANNGEHGEIVILGNTVSTGYYHQRKLTRKAFFECEKDGISYRGYHTGDLGYMDSGMLYYCGRMDLQIKLHGYRIEIEDIEKNILKLQGVDNAVVIPVMEDGKVRSLTAVISGRGEQGTFEAAREIKTKLKEFLPEYMVPKKIVFVDRIPMTINGKADRKAVGGLLK